MKLIKNYNYDFKLVKHQTNNEFYFSLHSFPAIY